MCSFGVPSNLVFINDLGALDDIARSIEFPDLHLDAALVPAAADLAVPGEGAETIILKKYKTGFHLFTIRTREVSLFLY